MNHPPSLVVLGYSEAAMFLRAEPAPDVRALVSIHGRREFGVDVDVPHRLDLTFDDVEVAGTGDIGSLHRATSRKRWAEQNGLIEVSPVVADAASIVRFAEAVRDVGGIVLCHCGGGMSRAPAAAIICLAVWLGAGSETKAVEHVRSLRRGVVPHLGLVRFADELLGRDGRLVRALTDTRA